MKLRLTLVAVIALLALAIAGYVIYKYYGYVFAKEVRGEIIGIERVTNPEMVIGLPQAPASQLFSFAVAIRTESGEIFTASSEDRQWAVAQKGYCVEAKFFPYAPWMFDKAGTYYGARLTRLYDCPGKPRPTQTPVPVPVPSPSP